MKVHSLCNDAIITEWMDTLNPSDDIKKIYLQGIQESPIG